MKKLALLTCVASCTFGQISVLTADYDNTRDGQNNSETVLTPSNLSGIVKRWSNPLDGAIMSAQPLYVKASDNGTANDWIISVTLNNSVYALNAKTGAQIWTTNLGSTWITSYTNFYSTAIGIVSTPVVDAVNGWVFVVWASNPASVPTYTISKLALSSGSLISSTVISGTYPGTGCGGSDHVSGGLVSFTAAWQTQRAPLTLVGGNIYFGFGSGAEPSTWHGWVFAYSESSLAQVAVLNLTPSGCGGGVWANIASDGTYLYFPTGNGDYNGTTNLGMSIVKTDLSLNVVASFTMSNWSSESSADSDLSSGKIMIIPGTNYLTVAGKDGRGWVVDKTNLCGLQGVGCSPQQVFTIFSLTPSYATGNYGGMFGNNAAVFAVALNPSYEFSFSSGSYNTTALGNTVASFGQMTASYSSNNGSNGIVWLLTVDANNFSTRRSVTLRAMNPANMTEYWNSGPLGSMAKFSAPLIANGMVYVSTFDAGVIAFGLVPATSTSGLMNFGGQVNIP